MFKDIYLAAKLSELLDMKLIKIGGQKINKLFICVRIKWICIRNLFSYNTKFSSDQRIKYRRKKPYSFQIT